MKAIVHIGATKTGSTTIQSFLSLHTEALAERGVRFAPFGKSSGSQGAYPIAALSSLGKLIPSAKGIARRGLTADKQAETAAKLAASLEAGVKIWREPTFVISSEHISVWLRSPGEIKALDTFLRPYFFEVSYVYYIRNAEDLVLSQYSQRTKAGLSKTFDEFVAGRAKGKRHADVVNLWTKAIGKQAFDLRLLDPTALTGGGLCDDFCDAIGVDGTGLEAPAQQNESLSALALEGLRILNAQVPPIIDGKPNPRRPKLVAEIKQHFAEGVPLSLTPAQRSQITAYFEPSNEALRRAYFPERATLFSPAKVRAPVDMAAVSAEAEDYVADLLARDAAGALAGAST